MKKTFLLVMLAFISGQSFAIAKGLSCQQQRWALLYAQFL